ncbi:hypothetical protein CONPUDRAFT_158923 [Coniophora puteana RWD-64-598 SS2]|uniref:Uncharacterized protein n=1 Tax=Coniophora puteana (strain RWD-64-598) TaxID=741705 RepID=A0A5M3M862_CONPW|nr:uncharacterized protein CONPUDRAFT_158923 [Coniophora puteana RWD-64-598 SS2]EIW75462.1 hypothetical protein CONPUDRAFT_158923 [Coniophora puteana RWD-64-598 SS2]
MPRSDKEIRLIIAQEIQELAKKLPNTVPLGEKDGKIYCVITGSQKDTEWETFDSRFNALMEAVVKYIFIAVEQPNMEQTPMMIKLERLKQELEKLVITTAPPIAAAATKSKKLVVPDPVKDAKNALRSIGRGALANHLLPPLAPGHMVEHHPDEGA